MKLLAIGVGNKTRDYLLYYQGIKKSRPNKNLIIIVWHQHVKVIPKIVIKCHEDTKNTQKSKKAFNYYCHHSQELKIERTASTKENMTQKLHTESPKEKSLIESLLLIKYKEDPVRC